MLKAVVSTVMSDLIFVCFRIVDYVTYTTVAFFYDVIIVQKKVPVERESSLSRGRAKNFHRTLKNTVENLL